MWPWGHLAVGYLLYSGLVRFRGRRHSTAAVVALALGTQFPDLVDKPLAWSVHLLPNGRSLAHSALTFAVVAALVAAVARRRRAEAPAAAFLLGYAAHLAADAVHPLVGGRVSELAFLAWPVLPPVQYDSPGGILEHFLAMEVTPFLAAELALVAVATAVWVADGAPGLDVIGWTRRRLAALT